MICVLLRKAEEDGFVFAEEEEEEEEEEDVIIRVIIVFPSLFFLWLNTHTHTTSH